ncbi:hypothetical protein HHI36_004728 [Cryptolaemus montrouzieri]|uniref:SUN domain-containing protein n=1 Tax=Cryptolaemus montrouzieri TaxID=559131 RepID=A0ABD2NS08_9CUCU
MKRTLWKIFLIACVFRYSATEIPSAEEDNEINNVVAPGNISGFSEDEKKVEVISEHVNIKIGDIKNFKQEETLVQPVFTAEAASQNSGALNDVNEATPVIVSLPETVSLNLQGREGELSASFVTTQFENHENHTKTVSEQVPDNFPNDQSISDYGKPQKEIDTRNETIDTAEEIPSFSEWAQKRLEEAEKNGDILNESSQHQTGSNTKYSSVVKLGWKNYASPDCGAKVVAANSEAVSPSSVISPSREEYTLNKCTDRIWFIIELCEAVQAKKIDIANFELFSSTPKDFTVSVGDRFPSREYTTVGQLTAKDVREVQSFDLNPYLFGRYIKVELKSHHGSQHFCPISLFRVYGISELEVLQKEELSHIEEDDEEDENESENLYLNDRDKNMLNSATNAVYSVIKKAAEALWTKSNDTKEQISNESIAIKYSTLINTCSTPSHRIICINCNDVLFGQIYELLSCKSEHIQNLVGIPFIRRSLINSNICHSFGVDFNKIGDHSMFNRSSRSVKSFFSDKILGAMCNNIAVTENKAVLNSSHQFPNNTKIYNETDNNLTHIQTSKVNFKNNQIMDEVLDSVNQIRPTEELISDSINIIEISKATCSTDLSQTSEIKPTKTVTAENVIEISQSSISNETENSPSQVSNTVIPSIDVQVENEDNKNIPEIKNDAINEATDANQYEFTTESAGAIEQAENFAADINIENGPSTLPSTYANNPIDRQKESVFLRLSNRIKALERNVSLSSQYLEELSRRYKKQVEEMQKLMDKTLQTVTEERKKMDERHKQLEERLDHLMVMVGRWPSFLFWFFFTLAAFCGVLWLCGSDRQKTEPTLSENNKRRKSVDVICTEKKQKVRRPSDQALKIVRSSLLSQERKLSREKRKRKRSNKEIKRSSSVNGFDSDDSRVPENGTAQYLSKKYSQSRLIPERAEDSHHVSHSARLNSHTDWIEENRRLLEIIPLDESEHSSLEPLAIMEQDVPHFTKTASDRRAYRMSSQLSNVNGDPELQLYMPRKSDSLDESHRFKGNSTRRSSLNSRLDETSQKKKKSFRNVLKNVFT